MRGPTISQIEKDIQRRHKKKDVKMRIVGLPKKYMFKYEGFKIYAVDGEWIRNNLDVNFGAGGHGRVHSFIPNDQVWVDMLTDKDNYNAGTIIHESNEFKKMKDLPFYHAHKNSVKVEYSGDSYSIRKELLVKIKKLRDKHENLP